MYDEDYGTNSVMRQFVRFPQNSSFINFESSRGCVRKENIYQTSHQIYKS